MKTYIIRFSLPFLPITVAASISLFVFAWMPPSQWGCLADLSETPFHDYHLCTLYPLSHAQFIAHWYIIHFTYLPLFGYSCKNASLQKVGIVLYFALF